MRYGNRASELSAVYHTQASSVIDVLLVRHLADTIQQLVYVEMHKYVCNNK